MEELPLRADLDCDEPTCQCILVVYPQCLCNFYPVDVDGSMSTVLQTNLENKSNYSIRYNTDNTKIVILEKNTEIDFCGM